MNRKNLDRFVLSVKRFNTIEPIGSIRESLEREYEIMRSTPSDVQRLSLVSEEKKLVSIVCYCFNPNHFHFLVKQEVDGGISEFFKRLLGGYTKYFNTVHNRSGSLFQGRFKSNLIDDDQYLLKIYPYVNMNYLVHDMPAEKSHLIWASDKEYDTGEFNLVSKEEAKILLDLYESSENFKNECLKTISAIREQRGNTSLVQEDLLP